MITYRSLIQAINGYLMQKYPKIKRFGNDTTEGWKKPYFFIECVPFECKYQTKNYLQKSCAINITYFQEVPDESDQLTKVEEIQEIIGMKLCVGNRKLDVKNFNYEYTGEYNNILQITIDLNWIERIPQRVENDFIESVDLTLKKGD